MDKSKAYDQIKWERDIAISQLESIGKSLGEKMDDIQEMQKEMQKRIQIMSDVTSVIKALDCCTKHGSMCGSNCNGYYGYNKDKTDIVRLENYREVCPYGDCKKGCAKTLAQDALALLKQHMPVEPIQDMVGDRLFWVCGSCGHDVNQNDLYCANCGREIKWDA